MDFKHSEGKILIRYETVLNISNKSYIYIKQKIICKYILFTIDLKLQIMINACCKSLTFLHILIDMNNIVLSLSCFI